jgi:hypothetical protein
MRSPGHTHKSKLITKHMNTGRKDIFKKYLGQKKEISEKLEGGVLKLIQTLT